LASYLTGATHGPLVQAALVHAQFETIHPFADGNGRVAARSGLEDLAEAGILSRKRVDRGTVAYLARDVFDLLTTTERRLASTRGDTRESTPRRPSPARPRGG